MAITLRDAPIGGIRLTDTVQPYNSEAFEADNTRGGLINEAIRGWNASGIGSASSALEEQALKAGIEGRRADQAYLQQQAQGLRQRAQMWAPTVSEATDINSLSSGVDWFGGAVGNLRSSVAPAVGGLAGAVAGTALTPFTGGVINPLTGAMIGAGVVGYNTMTDEAIGNAATDKVVQDRLRRGEITEQDILNTSRLSGAVQAPLEALVPAGLGSALAGGVKKEIGKRAAAYIGGQMLKEGGEEALTEGAQSLIGQTGQNYLRGDELTSYDWKDVANSAAAGFAPGAVMGGAGGAATAAWNKTTEPNADGKNIWERAGDYIADRGAVAGKRQAEKEGEAVRARLDALEKQLTSTPRLDPTMTEADAAATVMQDDQLKRTAAQELSAAVLNDPDASPAKREIMERFVRSSEAGATNAHEALGAELGVYGRMQEKVLNWATNLLGKVGIEPAPDNRGKANAMVPKKFGDIGYEGPASDSQPSGEGAYSYTESSGVPANERAMTGADFVQQTKRYGDVPKEEFEGRVRKIRQSYNRELPYTDDELYRHSRLYDMSPDLRTLPLSQLAKVDKAIERFAQGEFGPEVRTTLDQMFGAPEITEQVLSLYREGKSDIATQSYGDASTKADRSQIMEDDGGFRQPVVEEESFGDGQREWGGESKVTYAKGLYTRPSDAQRAAKDPAFTPNTYFDTSDEAQATRLDRAVGAMGKATSSAAVNARKVGMVSAEVERQLGDKATPAEIERLQLKITNEYFPKLTRVIDKPQNFSKLSPEAQKYHIQRHKEYKAELARRVSEIDARYKTVRSEAVSAKAGDLDFSEDDVKELEFHAKSLTKAEADRRKQETIQRAKQKQANGEFVAAKELRGEFDQAEAALNNPKVSPTNGVLILERSNSKIPFFTTAPNLIRKGFNFGEAGKTVDQSSDPEDRLIALSTALTSLIDYSRRAQESSAEFAARQERGEVADYEIAPAADKMGFTGRVGFVVNGKPIWLDPLPAPKAGKRTAKTKDALKQFAAQFKQLPDNFKLAENTEGRLTMGDVRAALEAKRQGNQQGGTRFITEATGDLNENGPPEQQLIVDPKSVDPKRPYAVAKADTHEERVAALKEFLDRWVIDGEIVPARTVVYKDTDGNVIYKGPQPEKIDQFTFKNAELQRRLKGAKKVVAYLLGDLDRNEYISAAVASGNEGDIQAVYESLAGGYKLSRYEREMDVEVKKPRYKQIKAGAAFQDLENYGRVLDKQLQTLKGEARAKLFVTRNKIKAIAKEWYRQGKDKAAWNAVKRQVAELYKDLILNSPDARNNFRQYDPYPDNDGGKGVTPIDNLSYTNQTTSEPNETGLLQYGKDPIHRNADGTTSSNPGYNVTGSVEEYGVRQLGELLTKGMPAFRQAWNDAGEVERKQLGLALRTLAGMTPDQVIRQVGKIRTERQRDKEGYVYENQRSMTQQEAERVVKLANNFLALPQPKLAERGRQIKPDERVVDRGVLRQTVETPRMRELRDSKDLPVGAMPVVDDFGNVVMDKEDVFIGRMTRPARPGEMTRQADTVPSRGEDNMSPTFTNRKGEIESVNLTKPLPENERTIKSEAADLDIYFNKDVPRALPKHLEAKSLSRDQMEILARAVQNTPVIRDLLQKISYVGVGKFEAAAKGGAVTVDGKAHPVILLNENLLTFRTGRLSHVIAHEYAHAVVQNAVDLKKFVATGEIARLARNIPDGHDLATELFHPLYTQSTNENGSNWFAKGLNSQLFAIYTLYPNQLQYVAPKLYKELGNIYERLGQGVQPDQGAVGGDRPAGGGRVAAQSAQGKTWQENAGGVDGSARTERNGSSQADSQSVAPVLRRDDGLAEGAAALKITESEASGYRQRAQRNADAGDVTIAFAADYTTGGEVLTKKVAGAKYVGFDGSLDKFVSEIVKKLKAVGGKTINVAGNGIYTWTKHGRNQEWVNKAMHKVLSRVKEAYPQLEGIVTGGQTGTDIAGAVAARALGLKVDVHMPKGFMQRNEQGVDFKQTAQDVQNYINTEAAKFGNTRQNTQPSQAAENRQVQSGQKGSLENPHSVPMNYKIWNIADIRPELRGKYKAGDGISALIPSGDRTATTRTPPAGVKVGDYITFPGVEGVYEVAGFEKIDLSTDEGREKWSKREGWNTSMVNSFGKQVSTGATQMIYERVDSRKNAQSAQTPKQDKSATKAELDAVVAEISAMVGPDTTVKIFKEINGGQWSGEWTKENGQTLIKIALGAHDKLGVGYHEAMHQLFSLLSQHGGESVKRLLGNVATNQLIMRQLKLKLAEEKAALDQLSDPEEAAAYTFQFWRADGLKVGPQVDTLFKKIVNALDNLQLAVREKLFGSNKAAARRSEKAQAALVERVMQLYKNGVFADPSLRNDVVAALEKDAKAVMNKRAQVNALGKAFTSFAKRWVYTAADAFESSGNPVLEALGKRLFHLEGDKTSHQSYLERHAMMADRYSNRVRDIFVGLNEDEVKQLGKYLNERRDPSTIAHPELRARMEQIVGRKQPDGTYKDGLLPEMRLYMMNSGAKRWEPGSDGAPGQWVDMGEVRELYWPRMWDTDKLMANVEEFLTELTADIEAYRAKGGYPEASENYPSREIAKNILNSLVNGQGANDIEETETDFDTLGVQPFMSSINRRELNWIDDKKYAKYFSDDPVFALTNYVAQSTKRAEFVREFGNGGEELATEVQRALVWEMGEATIGGEGLIEKAEIEFKKAIKQYNKLAPDERKEAVRPTLISAAKSVLKKQKVENVDQVQLKAADAIKPAVEAIQAIEGTLGHDIDPRWRMVGSAVTTYQNFRLLVPALFSNINDIAGIVARGGEVSDAFNALVRAAREIRLRWKDDYSKDELAQLAENIGIVGAGSFMNGMGQAYSSQFMYGKLRRANDALFKWNGLEAMNRAVRIEATGAAIRSIESNLKNPNKAHSQRHLEEVYGEGFDRENLLDAQGRLDMNNERNREAVMRWVNGAIIRPNASLRPSKASDPNYVLFYHLKQFAYAFQKVHLRRAYLEAKEGNYTPAMSLVAVYMPITIAADVVRESLLPDDDPPWMKQGMGAYLQHGVARANFGGVPQMYLEGVTDPAKIFGPLVNQVQDMASVPLFEDKELDRELLGALPGGTLARRLDND